MAKKPIGMPATTQLQPKPVFVPPAEDQACEAAEEGQGLSALSRYHQAERLRPPLAPALRGDGENTAIGARYVDDAMT
jgi:hypothetical protein